MKCPITTRTALTLVAAVSMAMGATACSDSSQSAGSQTISSSTSSAQQARASTGTSTTEQAPSNAAPSEDCAITYPATGRTGTVVVNEGDLTCPKAKAVVEKYLAQPVTSASGNTVNIKVDGWNCASPTAACSELQGIGTECTRGSESVRVVLPGGSTAPHQVSAGAYMRDDGTAYQFSANDGYWRCSIYADGSPTLAGCSGAMPSDAPQVRNALGTKLTAPNGVQLGTSGPAKFIASGDPKFFPQQDGGFVTGTDLPAGHSLSVGVFTCTALAAGVQCENRNTNHGFTIERSGYHLS